MPTPATTGRPGSRCKRAFELPPSRAALSLNPWPFLDRGFDWSPLAAARLRGLEPLVGRSRPRRVPRGRRGAHHAFSAAAAARSHRLDRRHTELRNDQGETSETRLRAAAGICGIAGPLSLTVYFAAPAFTNWPYAGASVAQL